MNGILVIDKPKNCTSRDVVNKVGKIFNTKKVGHTGTLDPMAKGVLVVAVNKALKLVDDIIDDIKFSGTGCSISLASASMLTEELKGLSVQKANEKIHDFLNMIMGTEFNEENLEDSIALQNISQLPARVKCATLAWKITEKILEDNRQ